MREAITVSKFTTWIVVLTLIRFTALPIRIWNFTKPTRRFVARATSSCSAITFSSAPRLWLSKCCARCPETKTIQRPPFHRAAFVLFTYIHLVYIYHPPSFLYPTNLQYLCKHAILYLCTLVHYSRVP